MKNANQIRQLLKSIEWIHVAFYLDDFFCPSCKRSKEDGHYKDCQLKQALALLPCETCNGTKQVPTPQSVGFGHENEIMDICPDCSPKKIPNINPAETIAEYPESQPKRECKNNKACPRYMDGTCLDCPDYK